MSKIAGSFNAAQVFAAGFAQGYAQAGSNQHIARTHAPQRKHGDRYNRTGVAGAYSNAIARKARSECRAGMKQWQAAHNARAKALAK